MKALNLKKILQVGLSGTLLLAAVIGLSPVKMALAEEPDTTAPTVSFVSPTFGSTIKRGTNVVITAQGDDNVGVTRYQFRVNGVVTCDGPDNTCDWVATKKGTNSLYVTAYDSAGNSSLIDLITVTVK